MTKRLLSLLLVLVAPAAIADTAMTSASLAHELDRLAHAGRVLYVAAHPDDENTRLLAYLANERHLTVAYLSMTRGGGGQNLVGDEQGELLDVIRTEELLAARRLDGAQQRFTRMRDFGYSKTADETFAAWDHEEALSDVVRVVRTFQPDVVIARFDEQPPNHGHHTASAVLAREAFAAAGDPARFPEQLQGGLRPWQPTRLVHNFSTFRELPIPPDAVALDVGGYDPRLGVSWGELAALSRSRHVSQGFGVAGERGPIIERFVHVAGTRASRDLLEGVDVSWRRFGAAAEPLVAALEKARADLDPDRPELALPALVAAHRALDALPDEPRVRDARLAIDRVIAAAAGLFVRATAPTPTGVPGTDVKISVEIVLRRPATMSLRRVAVPGAAQPDEAPASLALHEKKVIERIVSIPADAAVSMPYWLAEPSLPGRQVVRDPALIGQPSSPPALAAAVEVGVEDRVVRLTVPVVHAWVDPVRGERFRPFLIVPPATVTPSRDAFMFPNGATVAVEVRVRAGRDDVAGDVTLPAPTGWTVAPASQPVKLARAGDVATVRFDVKPAAGAVATRVATVVTVAGKPWSIREALVDHDHVPLQLVLQPSATQLVPLALQLPAGRVGYVEGSGDTVAEDLAHVGLSVEVIGEETLRGGDLSRFSAIVVGIRAFNTREDVRAAAPKLMGYVEAGGNLVVQYNTNNRLAPLKTPIGPHPFEVGRDRITDERAAMTPLVPADPVLHVPNEIGVADFEGWVQERGIYFASTWDERYRPLFSATDPGEKPLLGGTLVTRHGRGRYAYTGLAFFRQLPAGVPGAYRLFVNLLAGDPAR